MNTSSPASRASHLSDAPLGRYMQRHSNTEQQVQPLEDIAEYVVTYARQKPEMAALWCFGVGFLLGWKLKPW